LIPRALVSHALNNIINTWFKKAPSQGGRDIRKVHIKNHIPDAAGGGGGGAGGGDGATDVCACFVRFVYSVIFLYPFGGKSLI